SLRNIADPVNPAHLKVLHAMTPKKCGAREVAPNVWVKIDCHTYKPVPNARRLIFTPGRLQMIKKGQLRLAPGVHFTPKVGGGAPKDGAGAPAPSGGASGGTAEKSSDTGFPDVVDHRQDGTEGPIKNQEYTSMCTGFSLSATMDNAILRLGAADVTSPTHIWAHYGQPHMDMAADGNMNKPIALWAQWPFSPKEGCELSHFDDDCSDQYSVATDSSDSDPKIQSELKAADSNGKYKIATVEALTITNGGANPDEVAAVLATGADVWVAFSLDVNNWGYRPLQTNNNVIPDWTTPEGGHAVMLAGYRTKTDGTKQFLIHNSWGTDWGDSGYAWVSEKMVKKFMHGAYKITVQTVGAPPPQALTDDDCDSDQLVDSVTGKCASECGDGSRPANGACPTPPPPPATTCSHGQQLVNGVCRTFVIFHR
ncbi:MAG TPA: C1 family peptidase, partial [Myxococcota bacterium]